MQVDNPFMPNHALGYCTAFDSVERINIFKATRITSLVLYSGTFILGLWNIWYILVRQSYFKSVLLTMEYAFAQAILLCRILAVCLWQVGFRKINHNNFCAMTYGELRENHEKLIDTNLTF